MITFRPADLTNGEERTFVIASWSASYKQSKHAGMIVAEDWPRIMHEQIGKILARPASDVIIGVDSDDASFFYGWIAGDKSGAIPVVYYCYVKEPYRKAGYANGVRIGDGYGRRLLAAFGVDPSKHFLMGCMTSAITGDRFEPGIGPKIPRAKFEPNAMRYEDSVHKRPRPTNATPTIEKRRHRR